MRREGVGDGEDAGSTFAEHVGVVEEGKALHFNTFGVGAGCDILPCALRWVAIEDIGRMDTTEFAIDVECLGCGKDLLVEFWGWEYLGIKASALDACIGRVAIGYFGEGYIHDIETLGI